MSMLAGNRAGPESGFQHVRKQPNDRAPARPSSSVLLISPSLEILLLHRVQTSSSFPSAHVFPGGNIDTQDGQIPEDSIERHRDNYAYRIGALRELFEETGILLARRSADDKTLISLPQKTREQGRKLVHSHMVPFQAWLTRQYPKAVLDLDGLIPFSHWITPSNGLRRFTTQMYLYFLPSQGSPSQFRAAAEPTPMTAPNGEKILAGLPLKEPAAFTPTHDGNLESVAVSFSPASTWLQLAQSGSITLFPPQFLLLHLIFQFLDSNNNNGGGGSSSSNKEIDEPLSLHQQRQHRIHKLKEFVYHKTMYDDRHKDGHGSSPPYSEKCISPYVLALPHQRCDGRVVLGLDKPGLELEEYGLQGDSERVVLVKWSKEGPRELEVRWRRDVLKESGSWRSSEGEVKL